MKTAITPGRNPSALGLQLHPLRPQPWSQEGSDGHWASKKPQLVPGSSSSPSKSSLSSHQRGGCQHTVSREAAQAQLRPSSSPKPPGTRRQPRMFPYKDTSSGDFPGCPVVKICAPNAGGRGLILGQGTRSHVPQLKILHTTTKNEDHYATTKIWCSQIYIYTHTHIFLKKNTPSRPG